ncbi:MAG: cytochrome-c peroxidase [Acetobacteraceae bacterium]
MSCVPSLPSRAAGALLTAAALLLPIGLSAATTPPSGTSSPALVAPGAPPGAEPLSPLAELGRKIFQDTSLSEPHGVACISCHDPAKAFQGNNGSAIPALAAGSRKGQVGDRNSPSLMYSAFSPKFGFIEDRDEKTGEVEMIPAGGQFWDGRADDLAAQVVFPLLDKREMNNPSTAAVVAKIARGSYAAEARAVLGADVFDNPDKAFHKLAEAIAAYERTSVFSPFNSKFDAFLRGQEQLTPQEARGFDLFKDTEKGNCIACHVGNEGSHDPKDWLFTDFTYDVLGAPRNAAIPVNRDPTHFDAGLCKRAGLASMAPKDVDIKSLCGAFKVPTLRNIAVTAPYMHNGTFATLRDAVAFYFTRDTNPGRWYPRDKNRKVAKFNDLPAAWHKNVNVEEVPYDRKPGQAPRMDDAEIDDLVAFLHTLTDRPLR